jgi:glycosyltransferase involved in cell wall biosynthesis
VAHPVSVQICTLDEEDNIGACLESVLAAEPEDVVVIDGGSTDRTVAIAVELGVRVIEAGRIGLGRQRRLGYLKSPSRYTAFVDADDRLEPDWLAVLVGELEAGGYSALQSLLRVRDDGTWWSRRWNDYFRETIAPAADTIMVGRPALYVSAALQELPEPSGMVIEDTEMSRWFERHGHRQGIGTAVSYRLCPNGREENWLKWRGYGRGYRQFVEQNPDRRQAILRHMLVTVPIERTWRPVLRGHLSQPLFGAMMTGNYLAGWLAEGRDRA